MTQVHKEMTVTCFGNLRIFIEQKLLRINSLSYVFGKQFDYRLVEFLIKYFNTYFYRVVLI